MAKLFDVLKTALVIVVFRVCFVLGLNFNMALTLNYE